MIFSKTAVIAPAVSAVHPRILQNIFEAHFVALASERMTRVVAPGGATSRDSDTDLRRIPRQAKPGAVKATSPKKQNAPPAKRRARSIQLPGCHPNSPLPAKEARTMTSRTIHYCLKSRNTEFAHRASFMGGRADV